MHKSSLCNCYTLSIARDHFRGDRSHYIVSTQPVFKFKTSSCFRHLPLLSLVKKRRSPPSTPDVSPSPTAVRCAIMAEDWPRHKDKSVPVMITNIKGVELWTLEVFRRRRLVDAEMERSRAMAPKRMKIDNFYWRVMTIISFNCE